MRHTSMDSGFIVCWLINMILNWEFGAVALVLWTISLWFNVSWYPAAVVAGLWVIITFATTAFFGWLISERKTYKSNQELENVNPYSVGVKNTNIPDAKKEEKFL